MHIQSKLLWYTPVIGTHSSYQLGCLSTERLVVVVTLLEVSDREEGVVALHLPIGPLKTLLWVGVGTKMRTQNLPAHSPIT